MCIINEALGLNVTLTFYLFPPDTLYFTTSVQERLKTMVSIHIWFQQHICDVFGEFWTTLCFRVPHRSLQTRKPMENRFIFQPINFAFLLSSMQAAILITVGEIVYYVRK